MPSSRGVEFWQQHVQAQRQSGSSVTVYCRDHGLSVWGFYRWRGRLEAPTPTAKSRAASVRLLPVTIRDDVPVAEARDVDAGVEIRLRSGMVLSLAKHFDAASLRRAVEALS